VAGSVDDLQGRIRSAIDRASRTGVNSSSVPTTTTVGTSIRDSMST